MPNTKERAAAKRAATEAAAKGAVITALKKLAPIAKEINIRMDKAAKMEDDAYDHRLAAAHRLTEASDICKKTKGVTFKQWCDEHVEQSYGTCTKLVTIGSAKDPRLALEDHRVKNKLANAALRERVIVRKKAAMKSVTSHVGGLTESALAASVVKTTPFSRVKDALEAMGDEAATRLVKTLGENFGLYTVTKAEKADLRGSHERRLFLSSAVDKQIKTLFNQATNPQKMKIVIWAAKQVGVELKDGFATARPSATRACAQTPQGGAGASDDLTIPAGLDRSKGTARRIQDRMKRQSRRKG